VLVTLCAQLDLAELSAERIFGEFRKLLLKGRKPSLGLAFLRVTGLLRFFPELESLIDVPQDPQWHPEGDVWTHTLMVVDEAAPLASDLPRGQRAALLLAAVAHDFGKPSTTRVEDGRLRSRGHEEAGVAPALAFLERLGVRSLDGHDVRGAVAALVQYHLSPTPFWNAEARGERVSDGAFRRLALKVDPELLYRLSLADTRGRGPAPA